MKWQWSLLSLAALTSQVLAQEPPMVAPLPAGAGPAPVVAAQPMLVDSNPGLFSDTGAEGKPGGFLTGNHNFPRFIGFISNALQNIDPRSVTELNPIFMSNWTSAFPPLANDGNVQLYGASLTVAVTDRLAVGLNQGGYAVTDYRKSRDGWVNLGGFAQYTLIEDVPNQFLFTAGMRWEAPTGEAEVFQGHGPAHLAGYGTVGKEFGEFHFLATGGYQFPTSSAHDGTDLFYLNGHIDRRVCGWLYPLFEVNWIYHDTSIDLSRSFRNDFFDFGTFEVAGNLVTMAVGANAVIIPEKLEFGMVYTRPIASQRDFEFNGLIAKMVFRY